MTDRIKIPVICPGCEEAHPMEVKDSRLLDDSVPGGVRVRRYKCTGCGHKYRTTESLMAPGNDPAGKRRVLSRLQVMRVSLDSAIKMLGGGND